MEPNAAAEALEEHRKLLEYIGRVVVDFQLIELWIGEALAGLLDMPVLGQRYLVTTSMSYAQKVDLICELYPRKRSHHFGVEIRLIRRALYAAEAYRNKIVHSVWAVSGDLEWTRTKGSLKGKSGFTLAEESVKSAELEECVKALRVVRDWEITSSGKLGAAAERLESGGKSVAA